MIKSYIVTILNILISIHSFPQQNSALRIKSKLIKTIEFKDTTLKSEKEMFQKCNNWEISINDALKAFSFSKQITSEQKSALYNWLPCYFKSTVIYNKSKYYMEVNAASYIVLYNKSSTLYFGCSNSECEKFFILKGGNASAD
ncbi:MAG: hypothetical protein NTY72_15830 [Bacteroidetes bacterium]|nr:hypothetical protein [Bacteroidota bacterium]